MSTDNIDDLFRRQLGDHATPPGDDLWARLQAGPGAAASVPEPTAASVMPERVDELYKERLTTHVTVPSREVWERLEDEHLRPRKRRPAAWWPMAMAAAVALLLLAGGAGLWLGFPRGAGSAGSVASQSGPGSRLSESNQKASAGKSEMPATGINGPAARSNAAPADLTANTAAPATAAAGATATSSATAAQSMAQVAETVNSGLNQKNLPGRATRPTRLASSASKAGMMAQQSPRRPQGASRQPDAAAAPAPLVARTTPANHTPTLPLPADEPAPTVVAANQPATIPAGGNAPAATAASIAAASLITVDVRNGAARRPSLATAVATAAAAATEERRGLGGRLLRQVGHAVRGERISLSEVTGLPENLTLEANIAGRRVSKSIQL